MSGKEESQTLDKMAENSFSNIKDKINKFDETLNFPAHFNSINIKNMSAEECGELSVEISSYSIYIKKRINKEYAYVHWLESKINLSVANELNSYVGYYSNDQRRAVAIVNNEYAKQLEELRINSQAKIDIMAELPYYLNQLSQSVIKAQQEKRHGKTNYS